VIRIRHLAALLGLLQICVLSAYPRGQDAADGPTRIRISVYLDRVPAGEVTFTTSASTPELKIISSGPIETSRPWILLVDPTGMRRAEIERRVAALASAILGQGPAHHIRVGIPVLGGILSNPIPFRPGSRRTIVRTAMSYIPETAKAQVNLGRILDLTATLVQRAEETDGAVNCIVLARDREIEGDDADYLRQGAERLYLERTGKMGSSLYGYLGGEGALARICRSTGGLVFPLSQSPESVVQTISGTFARGYGLEIEATSGEEATLRQRLTFRARDAGGGILELRAPRAMWHRADGIPASDFFHMREALGWIRRAEEDAKAGDLSTAMRRLTNATREDPWNPEAHYLAGRIAYDSGALTAAADHLSRAIQLFPISEPALVLYGQVMERLGKAAEGLQRMHAMIRAGHPESPAIQLQTARLLVALGSHSEALTIYETVKGTDQDNVQMRAEYGTLLWRLKQPDAANRQIQSVLTDNPYNLTALACAADIAESSGEMDEAADYSQRAVQVYPGNADAHILAGRVHLARREWERAAESYQTALRLSPGRTEILHALATAQTQAGRLTDARSTLLRVLELDPAAIRPYQEMAQGYLIEGNLAKATAVLEQGAAQAHQRAHILFREAAEIRERRGEYGQALLNYRAMLDSLPPDQAAAVKRSYARHFEFLSSRIDRKPNPPRQFAQPNHRLIVPGGLATLSRIFELDASPLGETDTLERVFSHLLGLSWEERARLQQRTSIFFRDYESLLRHLEKKQIHPPGFDRAKPNEFVFPLIGDKATLKRTGDALGFFGIKIDSKRTADGETLVTLTINQGRKQSERRELLQQLGVSFPDPELREIRFTLGDESLPSLLPPEALSAILQEDRKEKSKWLFENLIMDPRAMRLYTALAACSDAARTSLIRSTPAKELATLTEVLFVFGRFLDFEDDRLLLPGSKEAWEQLLGTEHSNPDRFTRTLLNRDRGRALILYYVVSSAPEESQIFYTATAERLRSLYRLVPPIDTIRLGSGYRGIWKFDVGRILQHARYEGGDPLLPLDSRFGSHLFTAMESGTPGGEEEAARLMMGHDRLIHLIQLAFRSSPLSNLTMIDVVEFLIYLEEARPELLTPESIAVIMNNPSNAPVLIDLIWDIDPSAESLVRYFAFGQRLAEEGEQSWNVNRTRTSQSLFFLISALRREQMIGEQQGRNLFETALNRLDPPDESTFARQVARFLDEELLPVLGQALDQPAATPELVLAALAGRDPPQSFAIDNLRLRFRASSHRLARMRGTTQLQRFVSLQKLLKIYRLLDQLKMENVQTGSWVESLAAAMDELEPALLEGNLSDKERGAVAHTDFVGLRRELSRLRESEAGPSPEMLAGFADRVAASLHTEMGVTLLTYCYAYKGSPEIDALAFDPNFIRKHSFFGEIRISASGWSPTSLKQREGVGSYLAGSISGLGFQLRRLEWAESLISLRKNEGKELGAAMLSNLKGVRRPYRTNRAQEYVALTTSLARELLALAASEEPIFRWCRAELSHLMSPLRRNRVASGIREGDPIISSLTPSELFQLGRAYLQSMDGRSYPAASSVTGLDSEESGAPEETIGRDPAALRGGVTDFDLPVLTRLRRVVPEEGTEDATAFDRETAQYGVSLHRRFGLSLLSIELMDSYERLDHNAPPDLLYDRICDLKIRLAEINHSLGLPAYLSEVLGEVALRSILPKSAPVQSGTWRETLANIAELGPGEAREWIEELLHQGILTITSENGRGK